MEISDFTIERRIAEGGMASVDLAVQASLGRRVALKLLKKFDRPEDSERFLNEGRTIAALSHPNIITIHDIGFAGERPFIAMEYLEGGSLEQRIERGMTAEAAVDIVITIGACLDFVHRKGMIHRDVKPANILFHANGTAKLTDFGIAKSMEVDSNITLDGSAVGSPFYLSPEQAQNKPLDGRADVYSLGIIFYEMLTGKKPFRADSHIETILAQVTDELPSLPPELTLYEEALGLMTAKNPEERFSSAGEMIGYFRALRRFAHTGAGMHSAAKHPLASPAGRHGRDWWRDPRLGLALGATLSLALLAWIVGGWLDSPEPAPSLSQAAGVPEPVAPVPVLPSPVSASQTPLPVTRVSTPVANLPESKIPPDEFESAAGEVMAGAGPFTAIAAELEPLTPGPSPGAEDNIDTPAVRSAAGDEANRPLGSSIPVMDGMETGDGLGGDERVETMVSGELADVGRLGGETPQAPEPSQGLDVSQLLELADQAMTEYRLTIPFQNSALFYFEEVLRLEPGQPQAEEGLDRIAHRYANLGRREVGRQAFAKAERYVQRGLQVRPGYPALLEIQGELEARRLELAEAKDAPESLIEEYEPEVRESSESRGGLQSIFQH